MPSALLSRTDELLANRALHLELSKRGDERRRQHVEQLRVMTGEGTIEIGALEHQRIARGAVTDHASEVRTMDLTLRMRTRQFDSQWRDVLSGSPSPQFYQRGERDISRHVGSRFRRVQPLD